MSLVVSPPRSVNNTPQDIYVCVYSIKQYSANDNNERARHRTTMINRSNRTGLNAYGAVPLPVSGSD
jgi:hypothetical protein